MTSTKAAKTTGEYAGRILILIENEPYPFDQRVLKQATALKEAGYKVTVICPRGSAYDTKRHEVIDDVSVYRYRDLKAGSGILPYALEFLYAIFMMTFLSIVALFREGFDVIQLCNPPDLLFVVALPYKVIGKKIIFDHHDLSPELYLAKENGKPGGIVHKTLLLLEKISLKTADVVISTNESYKTTAVSRGGVDADRVFVVRNGPDLNRIRKVTPNPDLKKGKQHLIFYVGVIGQQDGVDYLLRSISNLLHARKRRDFQVVIMGRGTELDKLKAYARELEIDGAVTFTGRVPDSELAEALSTADVCVCPDPKTDMNNLSTMVKTMEYMALGKPIVAFDLKETKVSAGDSALYAVANDEEDFAEKIARLLDSPELRQKMGRIGKERIDNALSWEYSKKHLYAAYETALEKARAAESRTQPEM